MNIKCLLSILIFILQLISTVTSFRKKVSSVSKQQSQKDIEVEKCFGSVIDADQFSTKVSVYSWNCRDSASLPQISQQSILFKEFHTKLSEYYQKISELSKSFQPIFDKIKEVIPQEQQASSPITFGGTIGMRLLTERDQRTMIQEINKILSSSGFLFKKDEWARVISNSEEGVYNWISINYLNGGIKNQSEQKSDTSTIIDLNADSTYITYPMQPNKFDINSFSLYMPEQNNFSLYSSYFKRQGVNKAFLSVKESLFAKSSEKVVKNPCLNSGYSFIDSNSKKTMKGTSKPLECIEIIQHYFNRHSCHCIPNEHNLCSINGISQPKQINNGPIFVLNTIDKVLDSFNIPSPFTSKQLKEEAIKFCHLNYATAKSDEPSNDNLSSKCFLGIYISVLLSEGYNMEESRSFFSFSKMEEIETKWSWSMGFFFKQVSGLKCDGQTSLDQPCKSQKIVQNNFTSGPK